MIYLLIVPARTRDSCPIYVGGHPPPVLLLVVLARFVLLLVDKRSQPRTETAAIMALAGAMFFCSMKHQFLKL